jgi:hypothetical protein
MQGKEVAREHCRFIHTTQWYIPSASFLTSKEILDRTQRFEIIIDLQGIKSVMKC